MVKFRTTYLTGIIFLLTMQMGDVFTTYAMIRGDYRFVEMNPLMAGAVTSLGPFLMTKVVGVVTIIALCEIFRRFGYPHIAHSIIWVTGGFSACVVWSNLMLGLLIFGIVS